MMAWRMISRKPQRWGKMIEVRGTLHQVSP